MRFLLASTSPFDNAWPEQFRFPFGEWIKQLIFWAVNNPVTRTIGDIVEWPFATFFELIMSNQVGRDSITTIPWIWLVIAVFLVGSFTRNTRVGLAAGIMLATCAFLGPQYWTETAKTIGMIVVSVTLCAVVGIPLGVVSGRFDSVWNVVRPTLDGMQVIHSFVFMLPFIFFFGIGEVSATMVTMMFALPPLVRLTNLGIRQVPEDVVEASRAYGATETRVLTDVQLPLARPAIMTGLNQTLLLAISMLGIAALMGAGGLGKLLFRAINNQDLGLAASGGLAFFLVAVILDRISQTEAQDGVGLLTKVRQAWAFRADPEALLEAQEAQAIPEPTNSGVNKEAPAPIPARERTGLFVGIGGGVVAIVSLLLPWAQDSGLVSAWGRFIDESANGELAGLTFNGYQASGGNFFGIIVGFLALLGVLSAVRPMVKPPSVWGDWLLRGQGVLLAVIAGVIVLIWLLNIFDASTLGPLPTIGLVAFGICAGLVLIETFVNGTPRLGADGMLITGLGAFGSAFGYFMLRPSEFTVGYSHGFGVYVALIGTAAMVAGGLMAVSAAPYGPRRPLSTNKSWGRVIGVSVAFLVIVGSAFAIGDVEKKTEYGWLYDERIEAIERSNEVPDGIAAQVEALQAEGDIAAEENNVSDQLRIAQEITNLLNSTRTGNRIVHNGVNDGGPGLGWPVMILSALAIVAAMAASGVFGIGELRRWRGATVLSGLGLAVMVIPAGFILSIVRVVEGSRLLAGVGAMMTAAAGFAIFASGRGLVSEFRRRKVYGDRVGMTADEIVDADIAASATDTTMVDEPVGAGAP